MKHRHWLLLYDICEPKRLKKVCDIISCYSWRVQFSVFESDMDFFHIQLVKRQIDGVIMGNDFVAFVPLCESDWQKIERYGKVHSVDAAHTEPFIIL